MSGKNQKMAMIALILVILSGLIGTGVGRKDTVSAKETYEELKVFTDVMNKVKKLYVEEVDTDELIQEAIKGMMKKLDPHSALLTPDAYQEMQVDTKGKFEGLGIVIAIKDEVLTVISPIDDTPAFKAGIKEGDKILKIDGESTKDITIMDAVKKLRGPKGTKVTITIMREKFTEPRDFTITRDVIKIPNIKSKMLEDDYGYVRITQYQERTTKDLEKALRELEESSSGGLKGLILDLRRNPGGLLEQAAKVADCFLDSGLIVYTEGRTPSSNIRRNAHKENSHSDYPMVVLVNRGTASGSEIVAGALQDNGRAVIMGNKTFGKGSVQTIFPLRDGLALRLTTAKWYTPDGSSIHDEGITPDIVIEVPKPEPPSPETKDEKMKDEEEENEVEEESEKDYQLEKALEYLKTYVRMSNFKKARELSP